MTAAKVQQTLRALKAAGTAQNRKIYARHGAPEPLFGVSFKRLGELKKRLAPDQELAEELWATGNSDARYLALLIADAQAMGLRQLDRWARDFDHYVLVELFAKNIGCRSTHAVKVVETWTRAKGEWKASAGWAVLASLAMAEGGPPASWFRPWLKVIESGIDEAKNRVRHEMNGALIAIGTRSDGLARAATAAAKRIGPVEVDHGATGCKTPVAVPYIAKARAHRRKQQTAAQGPNQQR